jgi:hypothetical protein
MARAAALTFHSVAMPRIGAWRRFAVPALLLVAALLLRAPQFGNPVAGFDEQLYLLIGERMWQGAVPYLDLWDRKPPGLFAWFALMSAFGNGLIVSQLVATGFAAATAWLVYRLARPHCGALPALLGGLVYLVGLRQLAGHVTQTPVFYNLLLGLAALMLVRIASAPPTRRKLWPGLAAMLACGVAIQFKPTAALEGAWFGLFLLGLHWQAGQRGRLLTNRAALYATAGLLPSLIAAGYYIALGAFDSFWFANVTSIFLRQESFNAAAAEQFVVTLLRGAPMLAAGLAGLAVALRRPREPAIVLLTGWVAVGIAQFLILGSFWPHYLLPVVLPLSVLSAFLFARGAVGLAAFALVAMPPVIAAATDDAAKSRLKAGTAFEVAAAIPPAVRSQCLFVYEGFTALYSLTDACTVTRFVFTDHLRSSRDGPALGVDPNAELARALARRPLAVVTQRNSLWSMRNAANDALIAQTLARHYRLRAAISDKDPDQRGTIHLVWVRR